MTRKHRLPRSIAAWSLLSGVATVAAAQFTQYTSPGSLVDEVKPLRELIEGGWDEARWDFGSLRLDPRFEIRNLGYVDNVLSDFEGEEQISDFHFTIGAGLAAFWRLGNNLYATAFAAPQYNWWQDTDRLRTLAVSGGGGVHAFLNRLTLSIDGRTIEEERPLNAELEVPVLVKEDSASASLEFDLGDFLKLVASASTTEIRHDEESEELIDSFRSQSLDRDVDRLRAGLGFEPTSGLQIVLGLEDYETDFLIDPFGRSNSGTDPFFELRFRGNRVSADLAAVARELEFGEPEDPARSNAGSFDGTTGLSRVAFELRGDTKFTLYANSSLVYSALIDSSYLSEERVGAAIQIGAGSKLKLRLLGEFGDAVYTNLEMGTDRIDDFSSFGGGLVFELGPSTDLRLSASETQYDSNDPQFDRSTTRVELGITRRNGLIPF